MPNTQTSVPAFTAGQVLTAAQMTEVNTGIPVFATTTTRDAAFGGTGEKTLAEGQFAYIEASNTTQYYDGAAWQTVGGGLTLIKAQTIGTAVSSITVSDVFSSTYENYLVTLSGGVASTNNFASVTLGATNTNYYQKNLFGAWSNATITGVGYSADTQWTALFRGTTDALQGAMNLYGPNLAKTTAMTYENVEMRTAGIWESGGGYLNNTTQYTAFTLTVSSGTWTGGTIRVYGYQNS